MKEKKNKKLENYKECNLPMPYIDNKTGALEYVYYNPQFAEDINKYHHLTTALEDITFASVYYPYALNDYEHMENGQRVQLETFRKGHAHNFEELIAALYAWPESFKITEKHKEFYSHQELIYIRRTQNYLKLIGVKDIDTYEDKWKKYNNEKQKKYQGAFPIKFSDEDIKLTSLNKKFFITREYRPGDSEELTYKPKEKRALVVDEEDNFKFFIEFISIEIKAYKEIKSMCKLESYKDDDLVEIENFKVLETF